MNAALLPAVLLVLPALAAAACRAIRRGRLCDGIRPMYRTWRIDTPRARPEPRRPFSYELDMLAPPGSPLGSILGSMLGSTVPPPVPPFPALRCLPLSVRLGQLRP